MQAPNTPFQPTASRARSLLLIHVSAARSRQLNGNPLGCSQYRCTSLHVLLRDLTITECLLKAFLIPFRHHRCSRVKNKEPVYGSVLAPYSVCSCAKWEFQFIPNPP